MRVTDHALVRYIDRRLRFGVDKLYETCGLETDRDVLVYFAADCRVDVEAWRAELRKLATEAMHEPVCDRGYRWMGGLGFLVKDGAVVTVVPEDKPGRKQRLRRLPKVRRPAAIRRLLAKPGRVSRRRALEEAL